MKDLLIPYYIIINIFASVLCVYDKKAAIYKRKRIPEKTLFGISLVGGAPGFYISMRIFRHKTKKRQFQIIIPLFMIIHMYLIIKFSLITLTK